MAGSIATMAVLAEAYCFRDSRNSLNVSESFADHSADYMFYPIWFDKLGYIMWLHIYMKNNLS